MVKDADVHKVCLLLTAVLILSAGVCEIERKSMSVQYYNKSDKTIEGIYERPVGSDCLCAKSGPLWGTEM